MPFLRLNNIEIPVSECRESYERLHMLHSSNKPARRSWEITTAPLDQETATALINLLSGNFEYIGPSVGNNKCQTPYLNTFGGTSDRQVLILPNMDASNSKNVLSVTPLSVTNLLDMNTSSFETDYTGWIFNVSGLASRSFPAYHGEKCVAYGLYGSGDRCFNMTTASYINVTAGNTYVFSWMECHRNDMTNLSYDSTYKETGIYWYDSDDQLISRNIITSHGTAQTKWHNHSIIATAPSGATRARLNIGFKTSTYYVSFAFDAISFYRFNQNFGIIPPGYILNSSAIYIPIRINSVDSLSIAFNFYIHTFPTSNRSILALRTNTLLSILGIYATGQNLISALFNQAGYLSLGSTGWNSYGYIHDSVKPSILYLNGNTYNWTHYTPIPKPHYLQFYVHSDFPFFISDLYIFPCKIPSQLITQLLSNPYQTQAPYLVATGDITGELPIEVLTTVTDVETVYFTHPTLGYQKGSRITFNMDEYDIGMLNIPVFIHYFL